MLLWQLRIWHLGLGYVVFATWDADHLRCVEPWLPPLYVGIVIAVST